MFGKPTMIRSLSLWPISPLAPINRTIIESWRLCSLLIFLLLRSHSVVRWREILFSSSIDLISNTRFQFSQQPSKNNLEKLVILVLLKWLYRIRLRVDTIAISRGESVGGVGALLVAVVTVFHICTTCCRLKYVDPVTHRVAFTSRRVLRTSLQWNHVHWPRECNLDANFLSIILQFTSTILYDPARKKEPSTQYQKERDKCLGTFSNWNDDEQVDFVEQLLSRMCHYQHGHINAYLKPMLQRDFISLLPKKGLDHVADNILSYLDADSLFSAELVSKEWNRVISEGMLWKKLIERKVRSDSLWRGLAERKKWIKYLFVPRPGEYRNHSFYRQLYPVIMKVSVLNTIKTIHLTFHLIRTSTQSKTTGVPATTTCNESIAVPKIPRECTVSNTMTTRLCRAYETTPSRFGIVTRYNATE